MTKTCAICGRSFETARGCKKYCSLSCREAGRIKNRLHWLDDNPDYMRDKMRGYMKEYRKRKGAKHG
jgi:hypothetical protein